MKSKNVILLFLAGLCLTAGSCRKNNDCNEEPKDYRDKWVGDWDFISIETWRVGMNSGCDTFYHSGKISLVGSDSLNIEYTENYKITMHVDESGKLSKYYPANEYARGQFEGNDKIHLERGYHGLPGGGDTKTEGQKREGGKK